MPGSVTQPDISRIREFLTRHGRNPDAPIPLAQQAHATNDGWISIADRLPELPEKVTQVNVNVRHVVGDQVVESPARFVDEQSGLNPVGTPCFILVGRVVDLLNPNGKQPITGDVR